MSTCVRFEFSTETPQVWTNKDDHHAFHSWSASSNITVGSAAVQPKPPSKPGRQAVKSGSAAQRVNVELNTPHGPASGVEPESETPASAVPESRAGPASGGLPPSCDGPGLGQPAATTETHTRTAPLLI